MEIRVVESVKPNVRHSVLHSNFEMRCQFQIQPSKIKDNIEIKTRKRK